MQVDLVKRNNISVIGASGPELVYAHGFGCNQNMWNRITPAFKTTHRQVLFDYVGSGGSEPAHFDPAKYAVLSGYVDDLLEVCSALDIKSNAIFIGHSVSCSIGILASIAKPQLFSRMILLGPNPCFVNHPPMYEGGFEKADLQGLLELMDQNYLGWASHLAPIVSSQDSQGAVTVELSNSFCSTDPTTASAFANATFFSDNREDLRKVSCPSLILQHRHDALAPVSVGKFMHAQMPASTLQFLEVSGHCAHMSHPDLVIQAISDFIGDHSHRVTAAVT